ncbi:hypothetical protein INS90_10130 [Trueperella pecoris]|uniref:Uncharacterized protein n=1 Tax=Trueperella pecoris TaxID=2733571 RepID=A0A7M1R2A2_9ACTO|nr:hypothetical protein [Trueperella pecoris]QOR47587.1 hypothetical protein INS90_10130 [Trueperella pecoris]
MTRIDKLIDFYENAIYPLLPLSSQGFIDSDRFIDDDTMMVDDYLQFSLIHGVTIPEEILEETRLQILDAWDPEMTERTLGWLEKHRAKNAA